MAAANQPAQAISAYERGIAAARTNPDLKIELVSAKADSLVARGELALAAQTLDAFAEDTQMPEDLRGEALLHKAIIMRAADRDRQARLAENRAIEIQTSASNRAMIQKMVERLRHRD